jgi:hypothetical protein
MKEHGDGSGTRSALMAYSNFSLVLGTPDITTLFTKPLVSQCPVQDSKSSVDRHPIKPTVGAGLGAAVGSPVGAGVGVAVGADVGGVGTGLGAGVGDAVGEGVNDASSG